MTETFELELSDNQASLVKRAADLLDVTPEQYLRQAAINRNEAVNPRETISGSVVKRTTDGTVYELQPTDAGQLRLQQPDVDPGDEDPLTLPMGQFCLQIKGGEFYFPEADTSAVMDAIRALRR